MNSTEFIRAKQHINTVYSYIKEIEEQDRDNPHGDGFYKFYSQLNYLINFTNDNESIFIECIDKQNNDIRPFDEICKKVIDIIYNGSYQKIKSIFIGLDDKDRATNLSVLRNLLKRNYSLFISIVNELDGLLENKIITAFKVLKKLSSYDKTLIILGANGSGKTSFANFLRDVDRNIKVIPASKPIKAVGGVQYIYNSTIDTYQSELFSKKELEVDLLQKLIIGICSEHDNIARDYYDKGVKEKSSFIKIKEIFEEFFDVELDDSEFSNKKIMAKKKGCRDVFEFNNMSDGERVAFFYIATAIVAPEKSFIVVDEPETHLREYPV